MNGQELNNCIILRGINGTPGSHGTDGQSWTEPATAGDDAKCSWGESTPATAGDNGNDGGDGTDGKNGDNGTSVSLTLTVNNLYGNLGISVQSGDGGDGGNGGKGGYGQAGGNGGRGVKCNNEDVPGAKGGDGGNGGKGGNGGNGGNGGDGGIVTILYGTKNGDLNVEVSQGNCGIGGKGAAGGPGGSGGNNYNTTDEKSNPGQNGEPGMNGQTGNPGAKGQTIITKLPPQPTLSALDPLIGPATGGTDFVLTGENLLHGTIVKFNANPATDLKYVSDTEIHGKTPAKSENDEEDVYVLAIDTPGNIGVLNQTFKYTD